jgi:hypothetical protein
MSEMVETARRAFGDALSSRVNMDTRLGDVPVQVIREAMAAAIAAMRKPTPRMIDAGASAIYADATTGDAWRAMIDAALSDAKP